MDEIVGGVWEPPSATISGWAPTPSAAIILSRMIYGAQVTISSRRWPPAVLHRWGDPRLPPPSGGWIDQVLSRLVDLLMAIPSLIVALVMLSVLPV
jgi:peptide/nickel transport system permease protein